MKINEGYLDRILRVTLGIGVLSLLFWGPQTPWAYLGLIPLATGIAGYCPLYSLMGFTTCPLHPQKK